jgi:hypothetical protein
VIFRSSIFVALFALWPALASAQDAATSPPPPPPPATAATDAAHPPAPTEHTLLMPVSDLPEAEETPATAAATTSTDSHVRAGAEVFAQYSFTSTNSQTSASTSASSFDVPRVHGAVEGDYGPLFGRIVLEAVQSASQGALTGVAGDSLVMRVREAYAAYRFEHLLEVRAGVIPELTIPALDGTWVLRPVMASPQETSGLYAPADLGASVVATLPEHWGWLGVGAYNGEGYAQQELNTGKNVELAAEIHPLHFTGLLPLGVFGSYTSGSQGTESARANRLTGGLLYQGKRIRAGADYTFGWGVGTNGTQDSSLVDGFARVEPVSRFIVGGRLSYLTRNTSALSADTVTSLMGTLGWRFGDPLEAFVAVTRAWASTEAQAEAPGSDFTQLQLIAHVVF